MGEQDGNIQLRHSDRYRFQRSEDAQKPIRTAHSRREGVPTGAIPMAYLVDTEPEHSLEKFVIVSLNVATVADAQDGRRGKSCRRHNRFDYAALSSPAGKDVYGVAGVQNLETSSGRGHGLFDIECIDSWRELIKWNGDL